MTHLGHVAPGRVVDFGGEGPLAHAGGVRLADAKHVINARGAHARAGACRAGGGVAARDERVRAVVDVEQGALRALEQHGAPVTDRRVEDERGVGDERLNARGHGQHLVGHGIGVEARLAVDLLEDVVLRVERDGDLAAQDALVKQVLHADPDARGLVHVGRPDAAARGADGQLAQADLALGVHLHVVRHDQVRGARDAQVAGVNAALLQLVEFLHQHEGIHHHAVADDAERVGVEDAAGDEVQRVRLVAGHDGVARVVAALVARDHVAALGEQVNDLALALIAPLGADHHRRRHFSPSRFCVRA